MAKWLFFNNLLWKTVWLIFMKFSGFVYHVMDYCCAIFRGQQSFSTCWNRNSKIAIFANHCIFIKWALATHFQDLKQGSATTFSTSCWYYWLVYCVCSAITLIFFMVTLAQNDLGPQDPTKKLAHRVDSFGLTVISKKCFPPPPPLRLQ